MAADTPPMMVPMSGANRCEYTPKVTAGAITRAGLMLAAHVAKIVSLWRACIYLHKRAVKPDGTQHLVL
jgi:hypothetical protein